MHAPGMVGILLIVLVGLLLFGPSKLPELGKAFGRTLREFKNGAKEIVGEEPLELSNNAAAETEKNEKRDLAR
ncbi:twin-arginine translocase TatA/TatE family subunit [Cohnella soli]|uniref:Sec-independent protein translocase protein TatA n=1 Tax=Cohnella soli TaxID=425005 RepID=A0ABW0HX69_9BACL